MLRIDHGSPISEQRAFAYYTRIMGQNRDPRFRFADQKPEHQFIY